MGDLFVDAVEATQKSLLGRAKLAMRIVSRRELNQPESTGTIVAGLRNLDRSASLLSDPLDHLKTLVRGMLSRLEFLQTCARLGILCSETTETKSRSSKPHTNMKAANRQK